MKKLNNMIKQYLKDRNLFLYTLKFLSFDFIKIKTRLETNRMVRNFLKKNKKFPSKLHLGCGKRIIKNFLNVDLQNSEINIDLTSRKLPFPNETFEVILSQHVIEHLDLHLELEPLLKELHRVLKETGFIYLSCPCIKKICESYINDGCKTLVESRKKRFPRWSLKGYPNVQIINELFHQGIEHKNLFDYDLLSYSLRKCGFSNVKEIDEKFLLDKIYDLPRRLDEEQTLYVCASK